VNVEKTSGKKKKKATWGKTGTKNLGAENEQKRREGETVTEGRGVGMQWVHDETVWCTPDGKTSGAES